MNVCNRSIPVIQSKSAANGDFGVYSVEEVARTLC
jgi:hypothetical protein